MVDRFSVRCRTNDLSNYSIPPNPRSTFLFRETTGPEIWNDTDGKIDILVGGVGTGGTLTGCAQYLKPLNKDLKVIAVEPTESPVMSGGKPGPHKIQGIGAGFVPSILNTEVIDEVLTIGNETAFAFARDLARIEGIPVGISSGAAVAAACELGSRDDMAGKNIVVIIPSFAERYLTTALFDGL